MTVQKKLAIIEVQGGASIYTRRGWASVLQSIGYETVEYNIDSNISPFELINKVGKPSLFLGTTYNLNRAWIKLILGIPEMKVALYCSGWGELCNQIDLREYPIQVASDSEKKLVDLIKHRVSGCHIHIPDSWVHKYIGGWTDHLGIPTFGMMLGADLSVYLNAVKKKKYIADLSFVGGCWGYKSKTLVPTIVRLCREHWQDLNIKIYGNGWDVPQWLGLLEGGEDAHVFASSTICPNISEPHSHLFPDIIERNWKVPVANGFLITDQIDLSETGLQDIVPQFHNYDEFYYLVKHYLKEENIAERLDLTARQKSVILENHTYHDRMFKLLNHIGLFDDASNCLSEKQRTLSNYSN